MLDALALDTAEPPDAFDACASIECSDGQTCFEGACFRTCARTEECMAGEECTGDGRCAPTTPCTEDSACDAASFCDGARCVACDGDFDGYAILGAPAARCAPLREGDCDDSAQGVHPWALPDCDPTTTETCGTGMELFSPDNFEAGRVVLPNVFSGAPLHDVHVLPLAARGRDARTLVVFRLDTEWQPQFVIITAHPDGGSESSMLNPLPAWPAGDAMLASQMTAARDAGGNLVVTTLDLIDIGGVNYLSAWKGVFDGTSWAPLGPGYRENVEPIAEPTDVSAIAIGFSGSSAFVFANTTHGDGEHLLLYGLDTSHREEATGVPASPMFWRGHSGSAGGALLGRGGENGLVVWNGGVGPNQRYMLVDTMSSSRAGFGSGVDGDTRVLSAVIAPGPSDSAHVTVVRCEPGMACEQVHELVSIVPLGGADPLFSADHLAGSAFMTAGVQRDGSAFFAALDAGSTPMKFRSVALPEASGASWEATEVGTSLVPVPTGGVATAAMAGLRADGMDLTVLRVCVSF